MPRSLCLKLFVHPGRTINLTLLDYGTSNNSAATRPGLPASLAYPSSESQCTGMRYAVVKERANPRETLICGGGSDAVPVKHVYTSISNQLEISIIGRQVLNFQTQFIIKYEGLATSSFYSYSLSLSLFARFGSNAYCNRK